MFFVAVTCTPAADLLPGAVSAAFAAAIDGARS
jgi:hypothetical protein